MARSRLNQRSGLNSDDPQTVQRLTELVRVWNGEGRDPSQRVITVGELEDALGQEASLERALEKVVGGDVNVPPAEGSEPVTEFPQQPFDVEIEAAPTAVRLSWGLPTGYSGHAWTAVYRHTEDDRSAAEEVGPIAQATGAGYVDTTIEDGQTYYYWLRHVNANGTRGPWYPEMEGLEAEVPHLPSKILAELAGDITETHLHQALNDRIDLIDGDVDLEGSVAQRIHEEAQERQEAISDEAQSRNEAISQAYTDLEEYADSKSVAAQQVSDLVASFGGNASQALSYAVSEVDENSSVATKMNELESQFGGDVANVRQQIETYVDEESSLVESIDTLSAETDNNAAAIEERAQVKVDGDTPTAQYDIRLQTTRDGETVIGGFGAEATTDGEIIAGFNVDKFWLGRPGVDYSSDDNLIPFTMGSDGKIHIREASVVDAVIGNATIDEDGAFFPELKAAAVEATQGYFDELTVWEKLRLGDGGPDPGPASIESTDFRPGSRGFQITEDGDVEFNDATFRGHVVAESGEFKGDLKLRGDQVASSSYEEWRNVSIWWDADSRGTYFHNPTGGTLYGVVIISAKWSAEGSDPEHVWEPGDGIYYGFRVGWHDYGDGVLNDDLGGGGTTSPFITMSFPIEIPPNGDTEVSFHFRKRQDSPVEMSFISMIFIASQTTHFFNDRDT